MAIKILGVKHLLLTNLKQNEFYSELYTIDNFELIDIIKLKNNESPAAFCKNFIVFYNYDVQGCYIYNLTTLSGEVLNSKTIPLYFWDQVTIMLDKRIGYQCYNDKKITYSFIPQNEIYYIWNIGGIIELYNRDKTNNWLRCLDPNGGKEKWRIEYPGSISATDEYKDVLILEYHEYPLHTKPGFEGKPNFFNPQKYVIAIDSFTGKQIWKAQFKFRMRIDRNAGVVLQGGNEVIEWDIETGKEINKVKIITDDIHGHFVRFSNFNGYYYTLHKGSFGKINKKTGIIEWEFDLIDAKGEKRKLSDWILLGNGKLVLKAMPNHPNGELMCIFDPDENMDFANIVHGEKLK